jgi:putative phosphoribosyl transferase
MDDPFHKEVNIPVGKIILKGELFMPPKATSIIVFSHGSGSSRFSRRNQMVAQYLQSRNFGTLLFDLLTGEEEQHYYNRFDITLLTTRLAGVTEWLEKYPVANNCRIGFFGASTGAASALRAAALLPKTGAVVSRGGRPDLAMEDLPLVKAPTLLIVGSLDYEVIRLNEAAYQQMTCEKKLTLVEGATHLFEEPGTMEIVSSLAGNWFEKYLQPVAAIK